MTCTEQLKESVFQNAPLTVTPYVLKMRDVTATCPLLAI